LRDVRNTTQDRRFTMKSGQWRKAPCATCLVARVTPNVIVVICVKDYIDVTKGDWFQKSELYIRQNTR
jgi:hypothetical protein